MEISSQDSGLCRKGLAVVWWAGASEPAPPFTHRSPNSSGDGLEQCSQAPASFPGTQNSPASPSRSQRSRTMPQSEQLFFLFVQFVNCYFSLIHEQVGVSFASSSFLGLSIFSSPATFIQGGPPGTAQLLLVDGPCKLSFSPRPWMSLP